VWHCRWDQFWQPILAQFVWYSSGGKTPSQYRLFTADAELRLLKWSSKSNVTDRYAQWVLCLYAWNHCSYHAEGTIKVHHCMKRVLHLSGIMAVNKDKCVSELEKGTTDIGEQWQAQQQQMWWHSSIIFWCFSGCCCSKLGRIYPIWSLWCGSEVGLVA